MNTSAKKLLTIIAILGAFCSSSVAFAQSKVGFVNTEKILKESAPALDAQKALSNEFARRETTLVGMAEELKKKSDKLERDGSTMALSERQRLQGDLADADAKFQRERRNLEEEVQARRSQLLSAILERANREIVRIAEAEKIDIIFQDAVWASPKIDITSKVLDSLKK